jgi:hypothetical protein
MARRVRPCNLHLYLAILTPASCWAIHKALKKLFLAPSLLPAARQPPPEEWRSAGDLLLLLPAVAAPRADTPRGQHNHLDRQRRRCLRICRLFGTLAATTRERAGTCTCAPSMPINPSTSRASQSRSPITPIGDGSMPSLESSLCIGGLEQRDPQRHGGVGLRQGLGLRCLQHLQRQRDGHM